MTHQNKNILKTIGLATVLAVIVLIAFYDQLPIRRDAKPIVGTKGNAPRSIDSLIKSIEEDVEGLDATYNFKTSPSTDELTTPAFVDDLKTP